MKIHFSLKKEIKNPVLGGEVLSFMHPFREWASGIIVSTVIFITGGVYIVHDFYAQFDASGMTIEAEGQAVIYQETEVLQYAKLYNERDRIFQELRGKRIAVSMPVFVPEKSEETEASFDLPLVNE